MKYLISLCMVLALGVSFSAHAAKSTIGKDQKDYERSIGSVVRHKMYYKAGRIEVAGTAGVMPYDSVTAHYMFGGRLNWHFSDHFGWEILDFQMAFPNVTGFTKGLVFTKNVSNLQVVKLKMLAATGFILSPAYGKIRVLGRQVLYLDFYITAGLGMANTEIVQLANNNTAEPTQTSQRSAWDPMFHFGLGFKIFLNRAMGLIIDMRDYVISSPTYGTTSLRSNFSVFGGLVFFLPTFD